MYKKLYINIYIWGNSLIVGKNDQRDNVILNGDGDRYLLNKSINDFFKNRGSKISDATVDNDSGYDTNKKAMLKEILKKPMWARACCSLENTIPIALPFEHPYDEIQLIKTAYPRVLMIIQMT